MVRLLRDIIGKNPKLQIVCTTHSPYALDSFEPGEVRVMKLDPRGRAVCKALTDHPDWPHWKDLMNPGEFWSSVGEDWIFGERDGADCGTACRVTATSSHDITRCQPETKYRPQVISATEAINKSS